MLARFIYAIRIALPAALIFLRLPSCASAQSYQFSFLFGQRGAANGQIGVVRQVAVNSESDIFAADAQGRVSIFNSAGQYMAKITTAAPRAVTISAADNIVIAGQDSALYDQNRNRLRGLNVTQATGLAAASPFGNFAIIDNAQNARFIDIFNASGDRSRQIAPITDPVTGKTSVYASLAYAPDGGLYALDSVNQQVDRFDAQGHYLSAFRENGLFTKGITGIAVNAAGTIAISDMFASKVYLFDRNAQYIGSLGEPGIGAGQFNSPAGLTFAPNGSLIVSDLGNSRIEVFTAATPEPGGAPLLFCLCAAGTFLLRRSKTARRF